MIIAGNIDALMKDIKIFLLFFVKKILLLLLSGFQEDNPWFWSKIRSCEEEP